MSIAAIPNKPNMTPIFFIGDPPEGHLARKQLQSGFSREIVLFSEQGC
jgi:hypothetical protein